MPGPTVQWTVGQPAGKSHLPHQAPELRLGGFSSVIAQWEGLTGPQGTVIIEIEKALRQAVSPFGLWVHLRTVTVQGGGSCVF